MKKLDKLIHKEYPPVVLYLEDLEEIERVLRDNAKNVAIIHGNNQYDSVTELVSAVGAKQIQEVELRASDPYTAITFNKTSTTVFVSADETTATGVFYQIGEIILRCRRWFPWIYKPYFPFVIYLMLTLLSFALAPLIDRPFLKIQYYLYPFILPFFIWGGWVIFVRHSTVRLFKKPGSFIERNRDQLLLAIVSGLLGAIFGFLFGQIAKWF